MQRAVVAFQPLRRVLASRAPLAFTVQARDFSVGGKLDDKGKAIENRYFAELEAHLVDEYKQNQDKAEDLKALVDILGPNHGLSRSTIHKLCMWKHESDKKK